MLCATPGSAISDFDAVIRIRPGDALAYAGRAVAEFNSGQQDRGRADCALAGKLSRDNDTVYQLCKTFSPE